MPVQLTSFRHEDRLIAILVVFFIYFLFGCSASLFGPFVLGYFLPSLVFFIRLGGDIFCRAVSAGSCGYPTMVVSVSMAA